jgi:serine protease SohB
MFGFIHRLRNVPVVPVVRLTGLIAAGRGLSDQSAAPLIERAFRRGKPAAVAVVINSPGGSPVQSSLIAARIRRLADEKAVPVHVFVEDVAASGGYWLACAGDRIWVDDSSILGSIGVISASFGFDQLMARQGVERRVITAGRNKSFGDPFLPQRPEDVERIKALQAPIHAAFIAHVKARRGTRLKPEADLFNADVCVGAQAVEAGLADGIGHVVPKMKELFGPRVQFQVMAPKRGLMSRLGFGLASDAVQAVEERLAYGQVGLPG